MDIEYVSMCFYIRLYFYKFNFTGSITYHKRSSRIICPPNINIVAENINKIKKQLNEILSENTGQPYEVIEKDTDRDNYMSSEDAKEYGLIDSVITNRE